MTSLTPPPPTISLIKDFECGVLLLYFKYLLIEPIFVELLSFTINGACEIHNGMVNAPIRRGKHILK